MRQMLILIAVVAAAATAFAQPHAGDFWPAVTSGGQLALSPEGYSPDATIVLPAAGGLFQGWSSNNPGFDDVNADNPALDVHRFAPGGQIYLAVDALDPALMVWNVGLQQFPPGTAAFLGNTGGNVHTHLIWHINSAAAQFDDVRTFWRGTFRLIDTGTTGYQPSAPFTLYFSRVACIAADVNADGAVDFFDIDPFIAVLFDPVGATAEEQRAADVNRDGGVDFFDIDPFLAALFAG